VSEAVLSRARAGDEHAFGELTAPFRRELLLHCYRMLGSLQDAEDALQEALVSAWRGLEQYEGRASLRSWLYSIATNRCLNFLRDASRRPQRGVPFTPPPPTRMGEVSWLEPYPDQLLEGLPDEAPGPEALYETREAVGLAFITALQRLPPRQRAALVLRDVLGFRAAEAAELLGTSQATVNSALQRARESLESRSAPPLEHAPTPDSQAERTLLANFADAFERGQLDRVVSMLTEDAWVTMPPEPFEYQGHDAITEFFAHVTAARLHHDARLVALRANRQPAFAHYLRAPGEDAGRLAGLFVLSLEGEKISTLTRFDLSNLPSQFELPRTLSW
jgi:RNA polymerase sigma-70 factor (ECF subfamily)